MEIIIFCKQIYQENENALPGFLTKYEDLIEISPMDFVLCNFNYIPSQRYIFKMLVEYVPYLEKMIVEEWLIIQENILESYKEFSFITFVNKFLRVDLYSYLLSENKIKSGTLEYFSRNLKILDYNYSDQLFLQYQNATIETFYSIREKFIEFGMNQLAICKFNRNDYRIGNYKVNIKTGNYEKEE